MALLSAAAMSMEAFGFFRAVDLFAQPAGACLHASALRGLVGLGGPENTLSGAENA
jgi:hypothetical protein